MLTRTRLHPFVVMDGEGGAATPPADPPTADPPAAATPADPPKPDEGKDAAMARMRREADEAKQRADAAEKALADKERTEAEEQGRWKELAEKEKAGREALEAKIADSEKRTNAQRTATDLKFRDPVYALYLLEQDKIDLADPAVVKAALENLSSNRADLIAGTAPPPSGGPTAAPSSDSPKLTKEQVRAMTPQQVAALDPKDLAEALKA